MSILARAADPRPATVRPGSAALGVNAQRRIDRLEEQIREFCVDFERFFCGDRPVPPEPLRQEILGEFRQLRAGSLLRASVDAFRVAQLEARFNSYSEMFNRRTREQEEGKRRSVVGERVPEVDPGRGVIVGERLDEDAVVALYRGLAASPTPPSFDLESFRSYLGRQLAAIRTKTGCEQVQFRLVTEAGTTKLKAKPLAAAARAIGGDVTRPTPWIAAVACIALAFTAAGTAPPNLAKALEAQQRLAAERADDPAVFNDLGNLLTLAGDTAGAETAYRRAVELGPDRTAPRYNLGLLLQERGDRKEALREFQKVIATDPRHAWAHYQTGSLYEAGGDESKAIRAYARAFALEPRLAFAEYNPQIIENHLVAESMLRGYRATGSEPQAPKVYEDPSRIASLLLPPMAPAATAAPVANAEEAEAPAGTPDVLSGADLDPRNAVNQASPQGASGGRSPATARFTPRPVVRTRPVNQGVGIGPGQPGFVAVQPGTVVLPGDPSAPQPQRTSQPPGQVYYQPGVSSTGRLDLEVIPGPGNSPDRLD